MVYKVPQFIEVEAKAFGPLTFKQALYVAGGGGACFMLWTFIPHIIAFFLIIPVATFALALAFYKVNNRPFVVLVESFLRWQLSGRLYLWKHAEPKVVKPTDDALAGKAGRGAIGGTTVPKLSENRLRDLAWSLDVNENVNN